jgi:hypothetical protein
MVAHNEDSSKVLLEKKKRARNTYDVTNEIWYPGVVKHWNEVFGMYPSARGYMTSPYIPMEKRTNIVFVMPMDS